MKKDTSALLEALKDFSDFHRFYEANVNELQKVSLSTALSSLIDQKGLEKAQVVRQAYMSEVYAYQILSGVRLHPTRNKVLCLTLAMKLTPE